MQQLACDVWAIDRDKLSQFLAASSRIPPGSEAARAVSQSAPQRQKSIAVIPIHGVLEARPSFVGEMLGMPSYERLGQVFDAMVADTSVGSIVLDVASPGGMVYGVMELANKIYNARGTKPILAVANPMAASGAYWLATAADRLIVSESGDVGSVGVITDHVDMSQAMATEGVKVTVIRSTKSPHKGETNDAEPLSDEAAANLQARADRIYDKFAADLAKFRGVSVDHVNEKFGKGRIVDAATAVRVGMADRVGSLGQVVDGLVSGRIRIGREAAQDNWNSETVRDTWRRQAAAIMAVADSIPQIS